MKKIAVMFIPFGFKGDEGRKMMKYCEIAVTNCFYTFWLHVASFLLGWILTSPKILSPLYFGSRTPSFPDKVVSLLAGGYFAVSFNANSLMIVFQAFSALCTVLYRLKVLRYVHFIRKNDFSRKFACIKILISGMTVRMT